MFLPLMGASQCQMKGVHHNWLEPLLVYSQIKYFDETWGQEEGKEGIKGFVEVQCQEGWVVL
jgi:hypothetical protein